MEQSIVDSREAGMLTTTGVQGVGKTYQNIHIIAKYVKDKIETKVRGRKMLIFDTNGEYTAEEFAKAGLPNVQIKLIKLEDVKAFSYSGLIEIRRIDAKHLTADQKQAVLEYILRVYRDGGLMVEDINTYILNMTHMKEIVGRLVNLRHRAVDVIISYQSLRPVEPRIWANSRWIRMHFQADDVNDINGKVTNIELFNIAQIMINQRFYLGGENERFFVYITKFGRKLEGAFTKEEFMDASRKYLILNKGKVIKHALIQELDEKEALMDLVNFYYKIYYDNPDKEVDPKQLN